MQFLGPKIFLENLILKTMDKKKIIELRAQKILVDFSIYNPPVPIEEIVHKLGIKVSFAPSKDYSGMLIRKKEQTLMGINSDEPETRKRFSIAHELGHFLFSKKSVSVDYRISEYVEKPEEEKQADLFAASILMPRRWVSRDFERISKNAITQIDLTGLAKKYKVSPDAMKYRLANIGLIELVN